MTAPESKPTPPAIETAPRPEVKREIFELVKMVALFLVLFLLLKTFVVEGYEVQGPSMDPTLHNRERILVLKLPHLLSQVPLFGGIEPIKEGDIVVFESNVEANKRYIKRVVAMGPHQPPGTVSASTYEDRPISVTYRDGTLFIDGEPKPEPYLSAPEHYSYPYSALLQAGEYYVLGDHRSVSKDSRSFGPITDGQIVGRAFLRFWPLSKFGLL